MESSHLELTPEANGAWWLPWSSKPVAREQRAVGSIPIRFRHPSPCQSCDIEILGARQRDRPLTIMAIFR